jgi:hypothetical protein
VRNKDKLDTPQLAAGSVHSKEGSSPYTASRIFHLNFNFLTNRSAGKDLLVAKAGENMQNKIK